MSKKWWYLLLVSAWMIPGLVERDPWKADEAYTYGLVLHMSETGDWVVPQLGGEPFMQKPPVFFATATVATKLFGGLVGFTTAARTANVIFLALTLWALWKASEELNGQGTGCSATILFMGCVIYLHTAHMLQTDVSLVAGFALAFYGAALALSRPVPGGIWLGTGIGIAFMSKGLLGPGLLGISLLATMVLFPPWRQPRVFAALGIAFVASLPWLLIWPLALLKRDQELFNQWFLDNNLGRFLGAERVGRPNLLGLDGSRYWFITALPWYTWPAFPLLCVAAWKERARILREPVFQFCLMTLLVVAGILTVSRNGRELYGLPLLVPASVLGARGIRHLNGAWMDWWRRGVLALFGTAVILAWVAWAAQLNGWIPGFVSFLQGKLPGYTPTFHPAAVAAALVATVLWFWWMLRQPRQEAANVAVNWTAGPVIAYLLAMSIWLPAIESNMSYRHLAGWKGHLPPAGECVASYNLGEPQRAMFHYYNGLKTERHEIGRGTNCNWFLSVADARNPEPDRDPGSGWTLMFQDVHSRKELFRLYRRN
ncbi:MAG TPA: glycosyltransferase family 39 protein [Candidatus Limnocylindria bacterium]|jgi:4-amino-4-deoxy-L-arabinose transferase-like glycosyltransferase|nr:glycosyltransferase family 39 protein [Candidatus Limnocylindria bacterium]